MVNVPKRAMLACCVFCLTSFGCASEKEVVHGLAVPPSVAVVSTPELPAPLLPEITLDVYAYPKAIATQEEILLEGNDLQLKRDAYLALVALHMSRVNPNQDFFAASVALDQAIELDPSLTGNILIQRWLDVFVLLHDRQEVYEVAGQLQLDYEKLLAAVEEQTRKITYLETTIEELKKIEIDVEKKRRLYR